MPCDMRLSLKPAQVYMKNSASPWIFGGTKLESFYGQQEPCWPTDPYLFLVWWQCGYPASDTACAKGWESLNLEI